MSNTDSTENKVALSRREVVKLAGGLVAAPAILRVIPANAQSAAIKIGMVSPTTGPIAAFGEADGFILAQVAKAVGPGIANNGKTYPIQVIAKDSQSSSSRAAEVASELILGEKVDLIVAANTPDTTNPVADQAEANEVPCITTVAPWQPYFFGRKGDPKKGFDWTYHFFWGLEDVIAVFTTLWKPAPTNMNVGGLFPNDADGNAWGDPQSRVSQASESHGFQPAGPRPLSAARARLQRPDLGLQEGQCRDHHRGDDPARLRDLLVAGGATGLQAENRDHRQGAAVPLGSL